MFYFYYSTWGVLQALKRGECVFLSFHFHSWKVILYHTTPPASNTCDSGISMSPIIIPQPSWCWLVSRPATVVKGTRVNGTLLATCDEPHLVPIEPRHCCHKSTIVTLLQWNHECMHEVYYGGLFWSRRWWELLNIMYAEGTFGMIYYHSTHTIVAVWLLHTVWTF